MRPGPSRVMAANPVPALIAAEPHSPKVQPAVAKKRYKVILTLIVGLVISALVAGALHFRSHQPPPFTNKDTIVLADFDNQTGESTWDATLKLVLTNDLQDSQYLTVLPEHIVVHTWKLMKRAPDESVTERVANHNCLRHGNNAFLTPSMAKVGVRYHLDLRVIDCETGTMLSSVDTDANSRDGVIPALRTASDRLRQKLGESLSSIKKNNPLPQATSSSLPAIQAYANRP